jgi:hypothetical protein
VVAFLNQWQTLVAGLLALIGAWWTVRKIRDQIRQTADLENDRRIREERAARIVLPLALSEITQYSIDCMRFLQPFAPVIGKAPQVLPGMVIPRIPPGILEPMQASARFADINVAESIGGTIAWLQVQHARLESLIQRAAGRIGQDIWTAEAIGAIMDAAELYVRCTRLFPYSRGSKPEPEPPFQQQLQTALFAAGIVEVDHPGLNAAIKMRPTPRNFDLP